uniref:Ubiquitin carboxyl-terminal hydrolase 18-like n=1 Tax=Rhizophora mucronata TaxID=61149 RepID=A0A2P2LAP0_RHIMU
MGASFDLLFRHVLEIHIKSTNHCICLEGKRIKSCNVTIYPFPS